MREQKALDVSGKRTRTADSNEKFKAMARKLMYYLVFALTAITSCSKKSGAKASAIDVSKQWSIDGLGNIISSPADGQWQAKILTAQELNLFVSLDTANLSGTTTPASVLETPPGYNSTYPNPFTTLNALSLRFANGFSGQIVFKCVIVDSTMTSYFKAAIRLNVSGPSTNISFNPTIPVGRFRIYYTLSSQSNPHFYKSWGNIWKKP